MDNDLTIQEARPRIESIESGLRVHAAAKINLNTATEAELDKLPHVGAHRSKAIIAARTREKFKNWDDFMARKLVPADVAAAIKDSVTF